MFPVREVDPDLAEGLAGLFVPHLGAEAVARPLRGTYQLQHRRVAPGVDGEHAVRSCGRLRRLPPTAAPPPPHCAPATSAAPPSHRSASPPHPAPAAARSP